MKLEENKKVVKIQVVKKKKMDLPYTAKVGQEVTNIAAVNASIDAMPITRGLSDDEVKRC